MTSPKTHAERMAELRTDYQAWATLDREHTRALNHRRKLDLPLSVWTKDDRSDERWATPEEVAKMQADADATVANLAAKLREIGGARLSYCNDLAAQLEAERSARQAAESEWEAALLKALDERNVATLGLEAAEEKLRAAEAVVEAVRSGLQNDQSGLRFECEQALATYDLAADGKRIDDSRDGAGGSKETP